MLETTIFYSINGHSLLIYVQTIIPSLTIFTLYLKCLLNKFIVIQITNVIKFLVFKFEPKRFKNKYEDNFFMEMKWYTYYNTLIISNNLKSNIPR